MRGKAAHVAKRIPTDISCSLQRFVYYFYQSRNVAGGEEGVTLASTSRNFQN